MSANEPKQTFGMAVGVDKVLKLFWRPSVYAAILNGIPPNARLLVLGLLRKPAG